MKKCESCTFFQETRTGGWCENVNSEHFIRDVEKNSICNEYVSSRFVHITICFNIVLLVLILALINYN